MTDAQAKYIEWRETPHGQEVYDKAFEFALWMVRRGRKHYSMQAIVYVIRFHYDLQTKVDEDGFKINNNMTSYLAKELMATGKLPDGFFEIREVKREKEPIPAGSQQALSL